MNPEKIIKGSRKKALVLLLLSIAFLAAGIWMIGVNPLLGWVSTLFFGLGIPASLVMMRPGTTYLRLDPTGFEMVAMSRRHKLEWTDVSGFELVRLHGNKMIAIEFSPDYSRQIAGRAVAAALSGIEAAIPDHYEVPIEEVLHMLLDWRRKYGQGIAWPSGQA